MSVVRQRDGGQAFQSIGGSIFATDLASGVISEPVESAIVAVPDPQPGSAASVHRSPGVTAVAARDTREVSLTKPGAIIKAARARIREINKELKRLAALKTEKEELERLVAAAKTKPSPKVRALRTG